MCGCVVSLASARDEEAMLAGSWSKPGPDGGVPGVLGVLFCLRIIASFVVGGAGSKCSGGRI